MFKTQSNEFILEILREDSNLKQEFYAILNKILKHLWNFDNSGISKMMREYLTFKKLLETITNFPKNREKEPKDLRTNEPYDSFTLSLEDREIAALLRVFHLKIRTLEKKIKRKIAILKKKEEDFISIIYLEHVKHLLKNAEFRELIKVRYNSDQCNSMSKNIK